MKDENKKGLFATYGKGEDGVAEVKFHYLDNDGSLYNDIDSEEPPEGMNVAYWKFVQTMAFLPVASMTNMSGAFMGRKWDVTKDGRMAQDVLDTKLLFTAISAQYVWDRISGRRTQKLSVLKRSIQK